MIKNSIFEQLCELSVCDQQRVEKIQDFVRDRNDISVYKCLKSKAIFLNSSNHIDIVHYDNKAPTHKNGTQKRAIVSTNDDSTRRFYTFKNIIRGKTWLDIGTGSGAVLDVLSPLAVNYAAVEPQQQASEFLSEMGHTVYRRLEDVPLATYQIVTLFHVFEHLTDPANVLKQIHKLMSDDGQLIIEVPHARDFLISISPAFRAHTFWSEHLFLHTRETLTALLEANGFDVTSIRGVQRYPLANHIHWLAEEKGAGQIEWGFLTDAMLDHQYESVLAKNDMTDTLVAYARKKA